MEGEGREGGREKGREEERRDSRGREGGVEGREGRECCSPPPPLNTHYEFVIRLGDDQYSSKEEYDELKTSSSQGVFFSFLHTLYLFSRSLAMTMGSIPTGFPGGPSLTSFTGAFPETGEALVDAVEEDDTTAFVAMVVTG